MLHRVRESEPYACDCALSNSQQLTPCGRGREHIRRGQVLAVWRSTEFDASSRRSPSDIWTCGSRARCLLFHVHSVRGVSCMASRNAGRTTPRAIGGLGWALFAYQLLGVCVSFQELSGLVRILTVALAICTGWAAWLTRGAGSASPVR